MKAKIRNLLLSTASVMIYGLLSWGVIAFGIVYAWTLWEFGKFVFKHHLF